MRKFVIGVIQMDSQSDVDENLKTASAFIEEAAARGAKLVAMPENMHYVGLESAAHAEEIPGGKTFLVINCGCIAEVFMRRIRMMQDHTTVR